MINNKLITYFLISALVGNLVVCDFLKKTSQNINGGKSPSGKRVILIGIDGISPQCINDADHSAFVYMMKNGSYSFKTRTAIETLSAPGWTNILCGMPTEDTGITTNNWIPSEYYMRINRISPIVDPTQLPCIFKEIKDQHKNFINFAIYNWDFFMNFGNNVIPGVMDEERYFFAETDYKEFIKSDKIVLDNTLELIKKDFDFLFVYFGSLDMAGHALGWCNKDYINTLSVMNTYVEIIFEELRVLGKFEDTYIILSTDHGGTFQKPWHGEMRDDNIIVPWLIMGPDVKKNYEIKSSIKVMDTTPTIMQILGLKQNPIWRGRPIMEIFENPK